MTEVAVASLALQHEEQSDLRWLRLIGWLDKDAACSTFVARLAARHERVPDPVVGFRESSLETLLRLAHYDDVSDQRKSLIRMSRLNADSTKVSSACSTGATSSGPCDSCP
jgi:hypothetical protein